MSFMGQKYVYSWQSAEGIIITLHLHSMIIKIILCLEFNKFSKTKEKLWKFVAKPHK
jgi:hypothetical protein